MRHAEAPTPASNTDQSASPKAEAADTHLYFHCSVQPADVLTLMRSLRETDARLQQESIARSTYFTTPIWLHVKSYGGSILDAFAVADCIQQCTSPIYSIVEGYACSAASIIAAACTKRLIQPNAYVLIHQFSSFVIGTYEQFKDDMILQDMLIEQMVDFYHAHSKLKRKQVRAMLQRDTWMNAQQALEAGLVDEILK